MTYGVDAQEHKHTHLQSKHFFFVSLFLFCLFCVCFLSLKLIHLVMARIESRDKINKSTNCIYCHCVVFMCAGVRHWETETERKMQMENAPLFAATDDSYMGGALIHRTAFLPTLHSVVSDFYRPQDRIWYCDCVCLSAYNGKNVFLETPAVAEIFEKMPLCQLADVLSLSSLCWHNHLTKYPQVELILSTQKWNINIPWLVGSRCKIEPLDREC